MSSPKRVGRLLTASTIFLGAVTAVPAVSGANEGSAGPSLRAALHARGALYLEETIPAVPRSATIATTTPTEELGSEKIDRRPLPLPESTVALPGALPIMERPGAGAEIGTMPAGSPTFNVPTVAWILQRSRDGRFGKVVVPYSASHSTGWIRIEGLKPTTTPYKVTADISERELVVTRWGEIIMRFPVAVGSASSPTPPGHYFVTDLVPFSPEGPLGAFAFGISGIQPNLPAGWYGSDQLAIHGTNDPSSIGQAVTAGCLRVTNEVLEKLKPVLPLGTPVIFNP